MLMTEVDECIGYLWTEMYCVFTGQDIYGSQNEPQWAELQQGNNTKHWLDVLKEHLLPPQCFIFFLPNLCRLENNPNPLQQA